LLFCLGAVFISVTSEVDEAFYKIRPGFYTSLSKIPHDKMVAGDSGIIYHSRDIGGKTTIEFKPITCEDCPSKVN
jgi:hypothetical protein